MYDEEKTKDNTVEETGEVWEKSIARPIRRLHARENESMSMTVVGSVLLLLLLYSETGDNIVII